MVTKEQSARRERKPSLDFINARIEGLWSEGDVRNSASCYGPNLVQNRPSSRSGASCEQPDNPGQE
jgi:hypothetical protein